MKWTKRIVIVCGIFITFMGMQTANASEMVYVQGGEFEMSKAYPTHGVKLSSFYMAPFELTFDEYDEYCDATGKEKPIDDQDGMRGNDPVMHVSWYEAITYCNWKSRKEGLKPCYYVGADFSISCDFKANGYRLPTEAEWEYAARGGKLSNGYIYSGSNDPDEVSWFWDNADHRTHPVGQKKPNELGLYDMSGNEWEWCWDWYDEVEYFKQCIKQGVVVNPTGPEKSAKGYRVLRGGSCNGFADVVNTDRRFALEPDYNSGGGIGFRLVRTAVE